MFAFKAAVLGGGTMGGEIAQVIANADVPVVVKDVERSSSTTRWRSRARSPSRSCRQARLQAEAHPGAGGRPLDEVMGHTGTTPS